MPSWLPLCNFVMMISNLAMIAAVSQLQLQPAGILLRIASNLLKISGDKLLKSFLKP